MLDKLQKNVNARSLMKKANKGENKLYSVMVEKYLEIRRWEEVAKN